MPTSYFTVIFVTLRGIFHFTAYEMSILHFTVIFDFILHFTVNFCLFFHFTAAKTCCFHFTGDPIFPVLQPEKPCLRLYVLHIAPPPIRIGNITLGERNSEIKA